MQPAEQEKTMIIGIPIYEKVDLLDVAAPAEIFDSMKANAPQLKVEVCLVAEHRGDVLTRAGVTIKADKCFDEVPHIDVLWVPGGDPSALNKLMHDPKRTYLNFLITRAANAQYVTSVCEGALLLAKAGLLDGYLATTHWAFIPCLKQFKAVNVANGYPRFVVDRNRVTGGGISSGLDEALKMVELLAGYEVAQQVQQFTQYYPAPPVASMIPEAGGCPLDE
ncbi:MAG TPA: DJ-1/PfpI family protein [Thermoanaerobaculia bacterium]|jgi:cyclohexyl-isocyanide hydratase|nr:DJ-1/PfpI family protein [Thermoanaerobaculia bacterium]